MYAVYVNKVIDNRCLSYPLIEEVVSANALSKLSRCLDKLQFELYAHVFTTHFHTGRLTSLQECMQHATILIDEGIRKHCKDKISCYYRIRS